MCRWIWYTPRRCDRAARPERGAVLELRELLDEIDALASEGDRTRYDEDRRYRWVIHRLWIAVGNEAAVLERLPGDTSAWRALRLLRNDLAHVRLPDIDEDAVWRMTNIRTASLRILLDAIPL